jgi:hypothetical protein
MRPPSMEGGIVQIKRRSDLPSGLDNPGPLANEERGVAELTSTIANFVHPNHPQFVLRSLLIFDPCRAMSIVATRGDFFFQAPLLREKSNCLQETQALCNCYN